MKYNDFKWQDFAADDDFIRWVYQPTRQDQEFWHTYIAGNPQQKDEINEARDYLLNISKWKEKWTEEEFNRTWENINLEIEHSAKDQRKNTFLTKAVIAIAASVSLVVLVVYFLLVNTNSKKELMAYSTGYGQTKELILPDSSSVTLNANSELTFESSFEEDTLREVWLQGEAYFSVRHLKSNGRFLVHTANLTIEVLGTEFNVNSRREETEVVLSEGTIEIDLKPELKKDTSRVRMKPGELFKLDAQVDKITKREVITDNYTSWRDNKLIFDETPIRQIARRIEDNYGVKILIQDQKLYKKKITGTIITDNLEVLLKALETTSDLEIVKLKDGIILKEK